MDAGAASLLVIVGLVIYFLPSMIGAGRERSNVGAIFALNLFLGWSLIGWVVALVWAVSDDTPTAEPVAQTVKPADPPQGDTKTCPFCAETIKRAAILCRFCGSDLPKEKDEPSESEPEQKEVDEPRASGPVIAVLWFNRRSQAEAAGLKAADLLQSYADEELGGSLSTLQKRIQEKKDEPSITMTILRGNEQRVLTVKGGNLGIYVVQRQPGQIPVYGSI